MPADFSRLESDLELAITAAIGAGRIVAAAFGFPGAVRFKEADQPVTDVDLAADRFLRDALCAPRPDYGWLSEETAEVVPGEVDRIWVVDPLDGTRNFAAGRIGFAVCVGLLDGGTPTLGVVYNPMSSALYHAIAGRVACRNRAPIRARQFPAESPTLVASPNEVERGLLKAFRSDWRIETRGSTALKMMRVAEGGADAYVSGTRKGIWDVCGGSVIAEAAGAVVRRLDGARFDFSPSRATQRGVIVVGRGGEPEIPRIVERVGSVPL